MLDTHAFLWFAGGSPKMPAPLWHLIEREAEVHVSIVTLWEIAIKHALGKIELDGAEFAPFIHECLALCKATVVPIGFVHIEQLIALPLHHRDPFDRMILAQAITENMTLVSQDSWFSRYDCEVIW